MRKTAVLLLLLVSSVTFGSHIVGGEFELLHIEGYKYRLNLIVYFDNLQGNEGARDANANVRFFKKFDNRPVMDITLWNISTTRVSYYQPACSRGEIQTDKLLYTAEIELSPEQFSDPAGYYISWERCCRNYTITNIFSAVPGQGPTAGMTFYLEFPPVTKNGEQFINSSPQLFPPLNDYACPNRPYWVDFAGIDVDGDSLVYSLITPTGTHTSEAIPLAGPQPAPYPSVQYRPGFSGSNIMNGSPALAISRKGFLTVTPQSSGLFVFTVRCEEFRDGEKLGEVVRDFQMLVLNSCPVADPPLIRGRQLTDTNFGYENNMSVTFENTTADEDRCIEIEVSDPDALKIEDSYTENIWLQVIALDFETEEDLSSILPSVSSTTLVNGSVESFQLCFDKCPLTNGPYTIGVIAFDDACALPLSDTLRLKVTVKPPANTDAYFITSDVNPTLLEGDNYQLPITGRDDDSDEVIVDILTNGFNLADVGMSFDNTINENGEYSTVFNWETGCDIYDFTERTEFLIKLLINDKDECDLANADTLTLDLKVILPPNTDPIISSDLQQTSFIHQMDEPLIFNVYGLDTDGDVLELKAVGDGFDLDKYDLSFPSITGVSQVESQFNWVPGCNNITLDPITNAIGEEIGYNKELTIFFVLNDLDKCKFPNYDSLEVKVTLIKPANLPPAINFRNISEEVKIINQEIEIIVGQTIDAEVIASDADVHGVVLSLADSLSEIPEGLAFEKTSGIGVTESKLRWTAECKHLAEGNNPRTYNFSFLAEDDVCYSSAKTVVEVSLTVSDKDPSEADFLPSNVFTPNNDGVNDTYSLPNLPTDNCTGTFLSFRVHNRWGTEVYLSINRDFVWDGKGLESGVYYYVVEYTNRDYSGTISLLY